MTRQINRRTPTDPGTARTKAAYEVIASKLAAEGDIFRRREDGLRIQLTRKLATTDWRLCEVVTMRRIEWHEIHG